jgi:thiol-disulfide isomerase/thioredoxin
MNIDLTETRKRTLSINQYIDSLKHPFKEKFLARKHAYKLNQEVTTRIKEFADKYFIVAFSAEWCKDCAANIPVLALISERTGLEVRVFGGLMKDPLSHERKWRIPPSPPEVETFNVDKIPLIVLFDKEGNEVGRIVENPNAPTLEEELLKIISEKYQ